MEKGTEEKFTTITLPMGGQCEILEGKGFHYFNATLRTKGNTGLLFKYLILELVRINGKQIEETELDEMHIRDISYMSETIALMMNDGVQGL